MLLSNHVNLPIMQHIRAAGVMHPHISYPRVAAGICSRHARCVTLLMQGVGSAHGVMAVCRHGSTGEASSGDRILYPERRRRYLGCIRIPISTIYQMGILEGSFKVPWLHCGTSTATNYQQLLYSSLQVPPAASRVCLASAAALLHEHAGPRCIGDVPLCIDCEHGNTCAYQPCQVAYCWLALTAGRCFAAAGLPPRDPRLPGRRQVTCRNDKRLRHAEAAHAAAHWHRRSRCVLRGAGGHHSACSQVR
jgi:hypothetical protein